jgi:hypothetical protein
MLSIFSWTSSSQVDLLRDKRWSTEIQNVKAHVGFVGLNNYDG